MLRSSCFSACCILFAFLTATPAARPQDTNCPSYPTSSRIAVDRSITLDRQHSAARKARKAPSAAVVPQSNNFIDDQIFSTMAKDGVDAPPLTTDKEFVRRIY